MATSTTVRPMARNTRTNTRVPITSGTLPGDPAPSASPGRGPGPRSGVHSVSSPPSRREALHGRRDGPEVAGPGRRQVVPRLLGGAARVLAGPLQRVEHREVLDLRGRPLGHAAGHRGHVMGADVGGRPRLQVAAGVPGPQGAAEGGYRPAPPPRA